MPTRLPARRIDAHGRPHLDLGVVARLTVPLVANSAVQSILNLTDLWFIGHISTTALAAVGGVNWLVVAVVLLLGGVGMAVQTRAAQLYGGGRLARAAQAAWMGLWGAACAAPLFVAIALMSHWVLAPFGLDPVIERTADEFWLPRMAGASLGVAVWGVLGFFNGIGRPRPTVAVSVLITIVNIVFNAVFIFGLHWGVVGSGLASTCAQGVGLVAALSMLLSPSLRREFRSHLVWRPRLRVLWNQFRLGLPMGVTHASDLLGLSLFQLMQVRLGAVDGAATQLVMASTAIAYMPGIGVAQAGTTLVGQSIGAGDRDWAMYLGTRITLLAAVLMGGIGVLLALGGHWVLEFLVGAGDAQTPAVLAVGAQLLWFAAAYQFFDGLNLGSAMCLRGGGDVTVPAALVLVLSWCVFVPLSYVLTFQPGDGFLPFLTRLGLPQLGYGVRGGWAALGCYVLLLGGTLFVRWKMGVWKRFTVQ